MVKYARFYSGLLYIYARFSIYSLISLARFTGSAALPRAARPWSGRPRRSSRSALAASASARGTCACARLSRDQFQPYARFYKWSFVYTRLEQRRLSAANLHFNDLKCAFCNFAMKESPFPSLEMSILQFCDEGISISIS